MAEDQGNINLLNFHKACAKELNLLLKSFNIVFFGYGCKNKLLSQIFPNAKIFNMKYCSSKSIAEDLVLDGFHHKPNATISEIDNKLEKNGESLILILLNINLSNNDFKNLKAIKLIGTIENINFTFEISDVEQHNFIFRDLTTFEDYNDEIIDIYLEDDKVESILLILGNVSEKSKLVFKELMRIGNCTLKHLFDAVKKQLMLTRVLAVSELLGEFIDHKVIKISNDKIDIKLNADDCKKLLSEIQKVKN